MFSYLRYFAVFSFIIVLVTAIASGFYYRSVIANNVIKELAQETNVSFSKGFASTIGQKYFGAKLLDITQGTSVTASPNFPQFQEDLVKYVSTLPIARFNILLPDGRKIISLAKGKAPAEDQDSWKMDFISAVNGNIKSGIVGDSWSNDGGQYNQGVLVRTFVPISLDAGNPKPQIIVELLYDVSPTWKQPIRIQMIGTGIILSIFAILYASLFLTIARAERIITRQHEANIELTEAKVRAEAENQEKSKFLANISHELRTPLNAIIGFSEIIKDEVMGPLNNDQYKDYVNDIYASGVHLLSLINDILDYSKAEAGKLEVDLVEVDVTKIMKSCLRLISPRAEDAGVILIDDVPSDHFVVRTDPKRLKQIILNLLSNSVKFTPSGGRVTMHSWYNVADDNLIIEVKDTGIGIAPKDISKVMSTFGQVENEYNRKYEGTGLGLPLSKRLIELMGGKFHIESEVNSGTTITLTLPKDLRGAIPQPHPQEAV